MRWRVTAGPRVRWVFLVALFSVLAACTAGGTGGTSHRPAGSDIAAGTTTTGSPGRTPTTSAPGGGTTSPAVVGTTTTDTPGATTTASGVPTLGRRAGLFASSDAVGFGSVEPAEIFNGGDPTGLVTHIVWHSWGGPDASGTGRSDYVGPGRSVADGQEESVTVVAFELGQCGGAFMYEAVEWYFAQHGQSFDPNRYEDVCHGTYVPAP